MAGQRNILIRERNSYIGLETVYCSYNGSNVITPPSGTYPFCMIPDVFLYDDIGIDGMTEAREDVLTESTRRVDPKIPYHGLRIATTLAGISKYCESMQPQAFITSAWTRPAAAGDPGATSTAIILGAALGGGTFFSDQSAGQLFDQPGSLVVAAGSTSTVVNVTAASGVNFNPGTFVKIQVGGSTDSYQWAKVLSVAADAITLYPPLIGSFVDGGNFCNLYNFFPADIHGTGPGVANPNASVLLERNYVIDRATLLKSTLAGVYGDVTFEFTQGNTAAMFKFGGKASDWIQPTEASTTPVVIADTMGAVTRFTPKIYIQSSTFSGSAGAFPNTIARGTTVVCPKFTIEIKGAYEMIRDLNAAQTVAGVLDAAGRPRFGKCMFHIRMDADTYIDFENNPDVLYNIVLPMQIQTGVATSFWIWEIACATLVNMPKPVKEGEYMYVDLEFNPLPDGTQAHPGSYAHPTMPTLPGGATAGQMDAATATFRVAFG